MTKIDIISNKIIVSKPDVEPIKHKTLIGAYVESSRVEDAVQTSNKIIAKLHKATNLFF